MAIKKFDHEERDIINIGSVITQIGTKEFKNRVYKKIKTINKNINDDDLYFSQMLDGYSMAYKPKYPNTSKKDFCIYSDIFGNITVSGNLKTITGVNRFESLGDFEKMNFEIKLWSVIEGGI